MREAVDEALKLGGGARTTSNPPPDRAAALFAGPRETVWKASRSKYTRFSARAAWRSRSVGFPVSLVVHGHAHRGQLPGRHVKRRPRVHRLDGVLARSFRTADSGIFEVPAETTVEAPAASPIKSPAPANTLRDVTPRLVGPAVGERRSGETAAERHAQRSCMETSTARAATTLPPPSMDALGRLPCHRDSVSARRRALPFRTTPEGSPRQGSRHLRQARRCRAAAGADGG